MLNPSMFRAFASELEKLSGVELQLVGYHREPEAPQRAEAADRWWTENPSPSSKDFKTQVPMKGLLNRLRGKTEEHYDREGWEKAFRAHAAAAPDHANFDEYEYRRGSQIKTPHSFYSGNKLIARTLGASIPQDLTSDFAYSDKAVDNRLSKGQIQKVLRLHAAVAKRDADDPDPEVGKHHTGFQAHGKALLADPKLKFARLEWC